jgi:hypothetical protein
MTGGDSLKVNPPLVTLLAAGRATACGPSSGGAKREKDAALKTAALHLNLLPRLRCGRAL